MEQPLDPNNQLSRSVDFVYPQDEPPTEPLDDRSIDLLNQLAASILPAKNPRLTLTCLCYAAGMDVGIIFGVNNTACSLAKALGIPKQTFSLEYKRVRKTYNLKHSTNIKYHATIQAYSNNVRKLK